jgi:hypothetical protein
MPDIVLTETEMTEIIDLMKCAADATASVSMGDNDELCKALDSVVEKLRQRMPITTYNDRGFVAC